MTKLAGIALLAAVAAALAGCGDSDKAKAKATFVRICADATQRLGDSDSDKFEDNLELALRACSGGCDLGDAKSCTLIADHVERICKVSAGMCEGLCDMKSASLKKNACPLVKTAGSAAAN